MRPIRSAYQTFGCFIFAALILVMGCDSQSRSSIASGKVSYKGQPLTSGTIEFHGAAGKIRSSAIGAKGAYSIDDAPVGEVTVVVRVPPPIKTPPGVVMPGAEVAPVLVPAHYSNPLKSGVKQTIAAGKTTVDIDLK